MDSRLNIYSKRTTLHAGGKTALPENRHFLSGLENQALGSRKLKN